MVIAFRGKDIKKSASLIDKLHTFIGRAVHVITNPDNGGLSEPWTCPNTITFGIWSEWDAMRKHYPFFREV